MDDLELFQLTPDQRLELHQLEIADYWSKKKRIEANSEEGAEEESIQPEKVEPPTSWSMTQDINLYSWQRDCLDKYTGKGIVKVVTGAGKTLFALALVERLQHKQPDLKVLIVVPTIVLLNQWYDVICKHSNLLPSMIGRMGGGYADSLSDHDVLIGVCNSVSTNAGKFDASLRDRLFFIADECHMYTGAVMSKVFTIARKYSLGLSATPDSGEDATIPEVITQALGNIFYTLNYNDAVREGFLPEFEIRHIALPLKQNEQMEYDKISREIKDLRESIFDRFPDAPRGGDLTGWSSLMLKKDKVDDAFLSILRQYISKVSKRKDLLYHAENREGAVIRYLKERFAKEKDTQVIMFHERIEEVMRLYGILIKRGIAAVPENSSLSDSLRANSIELFREGTAKVIVSGKALIQGFDAPAADCGINVASSGSQTQAIQSIGRILRKNGDNQEGLILRFYVRNTTDENIYRKMSFSTITGAKRNRYFFWDPSDENMGIFDQELNGPPKSPKPESMIDWTNTRIGNEVDFDADGDDFQIDAGNNIFRKNGKTKRYASNPQGIVEILKPFRDKMRNNYIRQTSSRRIFLRQEHDEIWTWLYCGQLPEMIVFPEDIIKKTIPSSSTDSNGTTGSAGQETIEKQSTPEAFLIKESKGKKIIQQKKMVNNMRKAIKSPFADEIFTSLDTLPKEGGYSPKEILIRDKQYVYYLYNNMEHPICTLSEPWDSTK